MAESEVSVVPVGANYSAFRSRALLQQRWVVVCGTDEQYNSSRNFPLKPCGTASCIQLFVVSGFHRIAVYLDSDVFLDSCEGGGGGAQGAGLAGGEAEAAGNAAQDGRPHADGSRHQEARGHHRAIRRPHPQQAGTPAAQGARRLSHSCPPSSFLVGVLHGLGLQVTWQTSSLQWVVLPCPSEIRWVGQSWVWYGSVVLATWQTSAAPGAVLPCHVANTLGHHSRGC